ncbi:unnamed protein product [Rhizophagus irregularis]|nr:unnamed protein product [Rhizophagus irregularis]
MSDNLEENNNKNHNNIESNDKQKNNSSSDSEVFVYEEDSVIFVYPLTIPSTEYLNELLQELLQELYTLLLNLESEDDINHLCEFINNFLFEYDLNANDVLDFMASYSENISYYSSLIGYFYQHGIGCEIDGNKALEIFSDCVKNNQKSNLEQENDSTIFCYNEDIRKLNEVILQYFYIIFLYEDVILYRKKNYKLHIKDAENGDNVSQYHLDENKAFEWHLRAAKKGHSTSQYFVANHYFYLDEEIAFYWVRKAAINGNIDAQFELAEYYLNNSINKDEKKAFKWYLRLANNYEYRAIYSVAKCYRDGIGIDKNLELSAIWFKKYIGEKDSFALNDFLNCSGYYSL